MRETVLSWPSDEAAIYAGILALLSLLAFFFLWHSFRRYRLIHDTPTSKVRSAAQGYVELFGTAQILDGEAIVAPLSGTQCCWWRYRIQKRVRSGKSTRWSTVDSGESDGLFVLRDLTGRALIDPEHAEITGAKKKTWYGSSRHPSGIVSGISAFGGRYRYVEDWLAIGSDFYALGELKSENPAGDFNLRDAVREKLKRWKQNQSALLARFDSNQDGQLCEAEWQQAQDHAKAEVEREYGHLVDQEPIHLLRRPQDKKPVLLSTIAPQKLAKRYAVKSGASAVGFLAAGAAAVWIAQLHQFF